MTFRDQFFPGVIKLSNLVLVGSAAALVLVMLYILYHYGWMGERRFADWTGMALYCILPAFFAALFLASLKLKPVYKLSLAALCLLVVTSGYGAELFMLEPEKTAWVDAPKRKRNELVQLAKQYGIEFDTRERFEVINDLRQRGIEAVPAVLPAALLKKQSEYTLKSAIGAQAVEVIPLGGIANKLTVLCNQNGQYVNYRSDQYGFHNPVEIWQSNLLEIAALGKSFTQGYCVPSDKNFVALIRNRHPATLNLGMATHGPLFMLAALTEYLPPLSPRVVLWFYAEGNHVLYLQHEKKSPLLMRYFQDEFRQNLVGRQRDIDRALTDYVETEQEAREIPERPRRDNEGFAALARIIKLTVLRQKIGLVYGTDSVQLEERADLDANIKLFHQVLSRAKQRVGAWNGKLHFVYLPSWARYENGSPRTADEERATVLKMAAALDIPRIDLHPIFEAHGDPLSLFPFRRFYHYNEQGHRLVSEAVLKSISP